MVAIHLMPQSFNGHIMQEPEISWIYILHESNIFDMLRQATRTLPSSESSNL